MFSHAQCWFFKSRLSGMKSGVQCVVTLRSSFRGWRWSSARWPGTRRSCRGTSWSSQSTHTCWRSRGPSYTAAPEWVCFYSAAHFSHTHTHLSCISRRDASPHLVSSMLLSYHWSVLFPLVTEVELVLTIINDTAPAQLLRAAPDSSGLPSLNIQQGNMWN